MMLNRLCALFMFGLTITGCAHRMPVASNPTALMPVVGLAVKSQPVDDDEAVMSHVDLVGPVPRGKVVPAHYVRRDAAIKPGVITITSPNYHQRPAETKIDTLILHHTSSTASAERIGGFFSHPDARVSSHYVVGKDGHIVQCVDDAKASWHAGVSFFDGRTNVNNFSLGIEICNLGDGNDPYTDDQYKALGQLVAYILTNYNIPWSRVTGHKDIARPVGRKSDPSPNFSYDRLKQEVQAIDPNAGM